MHPALDDEACYLALAARDARFDGRFFTGVSSTGIYCRPVCRVRTPRRENCHFFTHAAQAERAGYRPCLRCRPELAPAAQAWSVQDSGATLARLAAAWLDEPDAWQGEAPSVAALARRLGVSDRHLRRLFEAHLGVTPFEYLQTRRLLTAKQLLVDTDLPMTEVAQAAGFASLRRFNAGFAEHYGLAPGRLRAQGRPSTPDPDLVRLTLPWRPPMDVQALLGFFASRTLAGVERVDLDAPEPWLARTLCIASPSAAATQAQPSIGTASAGRSGRGWFIARFDADRHRVLVEVSAGLRPVLPTLLRRLRALFDLDADPLAIGAVLDADFPGAAGLRVPGTVDGFELAVRAILGQQVRVATARTFAQRLVQAFGEPIDTPVAGLDHLFPSAAVLARVPADALGALGLVRQRQAAVRALAQAVDSGVLSLHAGADPSSTMHALCALDGIGPWTAQYVGMRALRWPDAFPAGDIALHHALGLRGERAALARAQAWSPWRSYAVVRAWSGRYVPRLLESTP